MNEQSSMWDVDIPTPVRPASTSPAHMTMRASASAQMRRDRQYPVGAFRHTIGYESGLHPEDRPYVTDDELRHRTHAECRTQSEIDEGLSTVHPARSSVRRYRQVRTDARPVEDDAPAQRMHPRWHHMHWLLWVGLLPIVMVIGWVLISTVGLWIGHTVDTVRYGMPRTVQLDAVVGHHDSAEHPSHFFAFNLDGHLSVIELPGGDVSKAVVYQGPTLYGDEGKLTPVTLSVEHDEQGKVELVLHYGSSESILRDGTDGKFHFPNQ